MADSARDSAPDGSGPVLARAIVSLSLHRNADAEQEVARMDGFTIAPPPGDRAEAEAIRGDVALYRGDYRAALERYRTADSTARGLGTIVRLADWHRHRGDFAAVYVPAPIGTDCAENSAGNLLQTNVSWTKRTRRNAMFA